MTNQINFVTDTGETVLFFVIEQTIIGGRTYLLVTDQEDGDADCWMMRLAGGDEEEEAAYEMVEDEEELEAVGKVFAALLDDETTLLTD